MLSAAANGGEGTMPGDYQSWPSGNPGRMPPSAVPVAGNALRTPIPPLSNSRSMPPSFQPSMRGPAAAAPPPMSGGHPRRPPRRHRRRSITPEIVIERRSHHPCSSGRRSHVITIPLDNRPTLGLRGPPKRVIEIERVRCRRRRRPRSYCYEDDDYDPYHHPPTSQPLHIPAQSNVVVANPISVPCAPTVETAPVNPAAALLNNLTPGAIDNLPRQTVHLQPIHLPGSQADANTELQTVVFPAEIINPMDGSLSVLQTNSSGTNLNNMQALPGPVNIMPAPSLTTIPNNMVLPSIIQRPPLNVLPASSVPPTPNNVALPSTFQRPPVSPAMSSNPIRQRFLDLFQRLNLSQTQQPGSSPPPLTQPTLPPVAVPVPAPSVPNASTPIRPTMPSISQFEPSSGPYPPANIQPYRSTLGVSYPSSTLTSSVTPSAPSYRPVNTNLSTAESDIGPYRPANITPYTNVGTRPTSYQSAPIGVNTAYTPPSGPSMPRSILRNPYPAVQTNTVYTRFNPSNVSSSSMENSSIRTKAT